MIFGSNEHFCRFVVLLKDVTGSPAHADTIKRKNRASRVFIGDVTPVSKIPKRKGAKDSREKRNMNPNVAIELGYAQHALVQRFLDLTHIRRPF